MARRFALLVLGPAWFLPSVQAEDVKIGVIESIAAGPVYLGLRVLRLVAGYPRDVRHRLAWYQSQGMVKPGNADRMFGRRRLLTIAEG